MVRGMMLALLAVPLSACGSAPTAEREGNETATPAPKINEQGAYLVAHEAVASLLKDPGSAEFRNDRLGSFQGRALVCGEVNSKNGFGGMVGFQRYVSNGGDATVLEEMMEPSEFQKVWSASC